MGRFPRLVVVPPPPRDLLLRSGGPPPGAALDPPPARPPHPEPIPPSAPAPPRPPAVGGRGAVLGPARTCVLVHAGAAPRRPPGASRVAAARHYNSLAASRVGAFGPGWSSTLDMALVAGAGEGIAVGLPDGAEVGFSAGDDGVLRPETRPQLSLSHLDDGTWVLAGGPAPGATRWRFDEEGTLTAISPAGAQGALEPSAR